MRVEIAEEDKLPGQEIFTGDGAGRQREIAGHRSFLPGHVIASLLVQSENALGITVEPLPGFGK